MFGFLKAPFRQKQYRQIYAAICSYQRQEYGVVASVLISYEAVFLYQLAVDLGVTNPPTKTTPTCCRLRNDGSNQWGLDRRLAEFCIAFAVLLAKTKVEDDIRDSRAWLPRLAHWLLRKPFAKSGNYLKQHVSDFESRMAAIIEDHLALETKRFRGTPDDYGRPTGEAFGLVFGMFGELCEQILPSMKCKEQLYQIGFEVGKGILISDCVFDLPADRRRSQFNPIRDDADLRRYQEVALVSWSRAGWVAAELLGESERRFSLRVLAAAFRRVDGLNRITSSCPPRAIPKRRKAWSLRYGICDCACDGCGGCGDCSGGCESCGDAASCCGACGEASEGASSDCCLAENSASSAGGACSPAWVPCDLCICCEPCDTRDGKKKKQGPTEKSGMPGVVEAEAVTSPVGPGARGVAATPLSPSGAIEVAGKRYPARSDGEFIQKGAPVVVLRDEGFGFVVVEVRS